jgi:hypothetical protein
MSGKGNGIIRDGEKGGNLARVRNGAVQVRLQGETQQYSLNEVNTGKTWIDGRPIYRKVVDFGPLPNNTTKTKPHGIVSIRQLTSWMFISATSNPTFRGVPWVDNVLADALSWSMDSTNIAIDSHVDWSDHSGFVTLEYTRN